LPFDHFDEKDSPRVSASSANRFSSLALAAASARAFKAEYSLWERNVEDRILTTLRELGIGLVPYSPLGRGFLTGTAKRAEELPDDDWRDKGDPRLQGKTLTRT
jgi:aryl-alcohol dehydrogenase-like predicted oxidoreductase